MAKDVKEEQQRSVAPSIPFQTLLNFLEKTEAGTLPPAIDPGYFTTMSGGGRSAFMAALKWLGLLDMDGTVQPEFRALVDERDKRKENIAALLKARYPWVATLNAQNATHGALKKAFEERGLTGDPQRKAITFYLHAATYAGLPVSKNFPPVRGVRAGTVTRAPRKARAKKSGGQGEGDNGGEQKAQTALDEKRAAYIDLLMKKADESEQMDSDLLDRIEKLLGWKGQES
jgi:hypothetical protein